VGLQLTTRRPGGWISQTVRRTPFALTILLAGALAATPPAVGGQDVSDRGGPSGVSQPRGLDQQHRRILLRRINIARQKEMVSDAEKLVQLAGELDAEVRAAGNSPLSATQLDKIARIQKLAHSVKDKMQFAVLPY
jgi:hypothetical protein